MSLPRNHTCGEGARQFQQMYTSPHSHHFLDTFDVHTTNRSITFTKLSC
jgi:hypothetical protein